MSQNFPDYKAARDYAEDKVRTVRQAYGIAKAEGPLQSGFNVFMLPSPKNRFGFELRCEALEPEHYPPKRGA